MSPKLYRSSSAAALLLAAVVYLGLACALPLLPASLYHPRSWRGYTPVLFRTRELPAGLEERLRSLSGVRAVVSERTATVSFNAFDGMVRVPVDRLASRLEGRDPRFDPYLKRIDRYFHLTIGGAPACAVYLRTSVSPFLLRGRIAALAEEAGVQFLLPDFDPDLRRSMAGAGGLALLLLRVRRLRRLHPVLQLAAACPWLANLVAGGPADLLAFFLLPPAVLYLLELRARRLQERLAYGWKESLRPRALRLVPSMLLWAAVGLLLLSPREPARLLVRMAAATGLNLALFPLLRLFYIRRFRLASHFPFAPLPILHRGTTIRRPAPAEFVWTALFLGAMGLSILPARLALQPSFPAPQRAAGDRELSWAALEALHFNRNAAALPDLSDFVTHAAYQEGFVFGRAYAFPLPGERIYLSRYTPGSDGRRIFKTWRTVKRFEPAWLGITLAGLGEESVERMLLEQGRAVAVERVSISRLQQEALPAWKLPVLVLLLVACFLIWDLQWAGGPVIFIRHLAPGGNTP
jgi:hypothetical protein